MLNYHQIYAIRYTHHHCLARENFIGGDIHDGLMPIDYFVWAIVGDERTIIVDTGFDAAMAEKRSRTLIHPIAAGL